MNNINFNREIRLESYRYANLPWFKLLIVFHFSTKMCNFTPNYMSILS